MNTIRVEFKNELGDQFVNMRAFKTIPWSLSRRLSTIEGVDQSNPDADMPGVEKKAIPAEAMLELAERIAIELVVDGNVYDAWTGEPMAFPLSDKTIKDAPAEMLTAVLEKFGEMRQAVVDPK